MKAWLLGNAVNAAKKSREGADLRNVHNAKQVRNLLIRRNKGKNSLLY